MSGNFGANQAFVASQSSQSSLSRPFGFNPGDFYSSGGVFLSQLFALSVMRGLSPMERRSVLKALGEAA